MGREKLENARNRRISIGCQGFCRALDVIFLSPTRVRHRSAGFFVIAGAIVYLFGVFNIKAAMEEYYNSTEDIGLQLSGAMTFFFSTVYLQYHINRIARWKKTGVLK